MSRLSLPDPPKIKATNFRLQRIQAFNALRGGHHQAVDMGEPVWIVELETTPLSRAQGGAWKALLAKLRGTINTLLIHDVSRARPLAYLDSADSAAPLASSTTIKASSVVISASAVGASGVKPWGAPQIVELDRAASRVRVTGFVASADISAGDMGAWDDGPARRLHMITDAAEADADGEAWLTLEPAPPETAATAALPAPFAMEQAAGEFVVLQSNAPYSAPVTHQVTLQAAQVLRRS